MNPPGKFDPPVKFDPGNEAHVRVMRRAERRMAAPHGVESRGRPAREVVDVLDEEVTAEDAARVSPTGRPW